MRKQIYNVCSTVHVYKLQQVAMRRSHTHRVVERRRDRYSGKTISTQLSQKFLREITLILDRLAINVTYRRRILVVT